MTTTEEDTSTQIFHDPVWLQYNGGWLHSNNVLFYFATSPFFDPRSENSVLVAQISTPEEIARVLGTRASFENALLTRRGLQYVVVIDPLEKPVLITNPANGEREQSHIWVIRKQFRRGRGGSKDENVDVLGYYYIMNDVIYQAPDLEGVLGYRMLNMVMAVDRVLVGVRGLARFEAGRGHTYFSETMRKKSEKGKLGRGGSREGTPTPESQGDGDGPRENGNVNANTSDERTLWEALSLTKRYRKEYAEDMPLLGEPGNFRLNQIKNPVKALKQSEGAGARSGNVSKAGTPAASAVARSGSS